MSLTIKGATSGSVDVVAPASGSDVTLTLPTTTATVETTASSIASSRLTGALPAVSGALLTNLPAGGVDGIVSTANATAITIDSSENVGIGTTTPDFQLEIEGSASSYTKMLSIKNTHATGIPMLAIGDNPGAEDGCAILGYDNSNNVTWLGVNGATLGTGLHVKKSGNVGIGTSSPGTLLHVKSASSATQSLITFDRSDSAVRGEIKYDDTASVRGFQIGTTTQHDLVLKTHNTDRLHIGYAGWVQMPNQPVFMVHQLTMPNNTQGAATGGTALVNVGGHYNTSNGRFTAPIGGTYIFTGHAQEFGAATVNYLHLAFRKNGASYGADAYHGIGGTYNTHKTINNTAIFNLSVNDYIQLYAGNGARNGTQNAFAGYLIG
jgi:hypothetical protein